MWETKTDNFGKAEIFINPYSKPNAFNNSDEYELHIDNKKVIKNFTLFKDGINTIVLESKTQHQLNADICFVLDATGSMGDELEYVKNELKDVINRVKNLNAQIRLNTSSVFYRDGDDKYVTRISQFTANHNKTIDFINEQKAAGGGDFPEAVHTALNVSLNNLTWSNFAKSRILFLLLDAPPHSNENVIQSVKNSINTASKMGIKIIPITASGIDKCTEILIRHLGILTNSTYVFVTNDSGIGNDHIEASVGKYEVGYLNDLMERLVNKYLG